MKNSGTCWLKGFFVFVVVVVLGGCAGQEHPYRNDVLPPPAYADPETAQAMNEGNRYFKEGWWTGAEKQYRIAIKTFPSMPEAQYNLGLTLNKQGGRYQESRMYFKKALSLEPGNPVYRNAPPFRRYKPTTATKEELRPDLQPEKTSDDY